MLAKIILGAVLVSILPCESQRQRFVAVPFEEGLPAARRLHQQAQHHIEVQPTQNPQGGFAGGEAFGVADQGQLFDQQENFQNHQGEQQFEQSPVASAPTQQFGNDGHFGRNPSGRFRGSSRHQAAQAPINQLTGSTRHTSIPFDQATHLTSLDNIQPHRPSPSFDFGSATPITLSSRSHFPRHRFGHQQEDDSQASSPSFDPHRGLQNPSPAPAPQPQPFEPTHSFLSVEEPTLTLLDHQPAPVQQRHRPAPRPSSVQSFLHHVQPTTPRAPPVLQPLRRAFVPSHQQQQQQQQLQQQQVSSNPRFPQQPEFIIDVQPEVAVPAPQPIPTQQIHRSNPRLQVPLSTRQRQQDYEEELFRQQAQSAKYSFASNIDDTINGNQHQREEVRDGANVKGMYSYSDGYVKRTVFYEADDKGYRVVKEEEEPLGDGPQFDPNGQANVRSFVAGNDVQYSITAADIPFSRNKQPQAPQFETHF